MTSAERQARAQLDGMLDGNPFTAAALVLLTESGCTIRKWRGSTTGIAHTSARDWGIESPVPRTPISFGVFAHEVGHQMLHRGSSLPRYVEEVQAWEFALDAAKRFDVEPAPHDRVAKSLTYSFAKALRRGVSPARILADPETQWWAVEIDVRQLAEDLLHEGEAC